MKDQITIFIIILAAVATATLLWLGIARADSKLVGADNKVYTNVDILNYLEAKQLESRGIEITTEWKWGDKLHWGTSSSHIDPRETYSSDLIQLGRRG